MSQKEIKRIKVMELLAGGKITNQEAAECWGRCINKRSPISHAG